MKKFNIAQISFLIACGSALQLAESFIPFPIPVPGLRIGLANISTLLGLVLFGFGGGLEVAVFRPIVTSLTNGTFLSPGFVLAFCGSVVSFLFMSAFYSLTKNTKIYSLIAVSILGAAVHNITEIVTAYYWLIHHHAILALTPFMLVIAVIGGYLVGWSSKYVLNKIEKEDINSFVPMEKPQDDKVNIELTFKDKARVIGSFIFFLSTIFLKTIFTYAVLITLVLFLILFYGQKISRVASRLARLSGIIIFSFLLPVIFSSTGEVLFHWSFIKITLPGILDGVLFALRLVFLIFISVWIGIDEPSKLSQELAWILSPLKYFHFSSDRIPRLTSLSLSFLPVIWERLAKVKPKTLKNVLDALSQFFVDLKKETGPNTGLS